METDDSSKNKLPELNDDPVQLGPSQDSQCAPSQLELKLQKTQMQVKEGNKELDSQNAALKEQMAAKELSWEQEKGEHMKALDSASASHNQARMGRNNNNNKDQQILTLQKALREREMETKRVIEYWKEQYDQVTVFSKRENRRITVNCDNESKASYKDLLALSAEWEQRWHVQQEEVFTQMEALRTEMDKKVNQVILEKDDLITKLTNENKSLEEQCAKLKEKDQEFTHSQSEWDSKYKSLQESNRTMNQLVQEKDDLIICTINERNVLDAELKETSAKLIEKDQEFTHSQSEWDSKYKSLQESNRTMNQLVQEKDDLIICTINERNVLDAKLKETSAKLKEKAREVIQTEAEWQAKVKAKEDQLKYEVAEKEATFKKMQELEREGRKEDDWLLKASQMEDNIKLLTQNNNELQELALMTDKEKAKIKKEAKKAKKDAEKKLTKERKEREEREKKERKKNEKRERERLEREKKEKKLREKKEKEKTKAKRWMRGD